MNKRNTSFYLTEETHTLIRRLAGERGTSKNQVVEVAVKALAGSTRESTEDEPNKQTTERLEDMRDQVNFLRGELEARTEEIRRRDFILSQLAQKVPELETSPEPQTGDIDDIPEPPEEANPRPFTEPETTSQRPWWIRILGG